MSQPQYNDLETASGYGSSTLEDNYPEPMAGLDSNEIYTPFHESLQHNLRLLEYLQETESLSGTSLDSGIWSSEASSIPSTSASTTHRRKGKRRSCNLISSDPIKSEKAKTYQCTFCKGAEFSDRYRWRRHEESVHFPQSEWICMSHKPTSLTENGPECTFCGFLNPTNEHLSKHNYHACSQKLISQRTFTRKDYLQRHLRQVHHKSQWTTHMDDWNRPVSQNLSFTCGFCGTRLDGWNSRVDHIASHFEDGLSLTAWTFISKPEQVGSCSVEIPSHDLDNLTRSLGAMLTGNEPVLFSASPDQEVQESKGKIKIAPDPTLLDNSQQQRKTNKTCWLDTWLSDQVDNFYLSRIPDLFPDAYKTDVINFAESNVQTECVDPAESEIVFLSDLSSVTITGLTKPEGSESLELSETTYSLLSEIPSDMDHLLLTGGWAWDLDKSIWKIDEYDRMSPDYLKIIAACHFAFENFPPPVPVSTMTFEEFKNFEIEVEEYWGNTLDVMLSDDFDSVAFLEQVGPHSQNSPKFTSIDRTEL